MKRVAILALLLALAAPAGVTAAGSAPAPTLKGKAPALSGVLVFHRYSNYRNWDSTLWMVDLATGRLARIGANWKVIHPMNAHFSADGNSMVFMGSQKGIKDWDIFLSQWDGKAWAEPANLTGPNDKRDEDPKFSADGTQITFKTDGVIKRVDTDGKVLEIINTGDAEASMPYFLPNGRDLLYESHRNIYLHTSSGEKLLWGDYALHGYYPIAATDSRYFFTQTQSNRVDRIMSATIGGKAAPLFFTSSIWDSSDPYPYRDGSRWLFYVSTNGETGFGGYDVCLADLLTKKVWNLFTLNRTINTPLEELGPSWSATAHYPSRVTS
jgi:Tol biopolymer transport system component